MHGSRLGYATVAAHELQMPVPWRCEMTRIRERYAVHVQGEREIMLMVTRSAARDWARMLRDWGRFVTVTPAHGPRLIHKGKKPIQ